jgi:hypothetical protein
LSNLKAFKGWTPLALSGLVIAAATLPPRAEVVQGGLWCVACGTRGIADFICNIILFIPLGLALALRRTPHVKAILAGLLFSFCIEFVQLFIISGRHANISDVLSNTTGVVAGYFMFQARPWRLARTFGWLPTLALATATALVLVGALSFFSRNFSERPYSLQWNPSYENHIRYQGDVIASKVGSIGPQTRTPVRLAPDTLVIDALAKLRFDVTFLAAAPREGVAPIMSVHDRIGGEIVLIAANRADLVLRYWGNADILRLDHPDILIPNVFAGLRPGDTTTLSVEQHGGFFCGTTNGVRRCAPNLSVGRTWNLLISPESRTANANVPAFLWLALSFFPIGFFARNLHTSAVAVVAILPALWLLPLEIGFAPVQWVELAGLLCGVLLAHGTALWVVRKDAASN